MRVARNIPGIPTGTLFKFPANLATRRYPGKYSVELRQLDGIFSQIPSSSVRNAVAAAAADAVGYPGNDTGCSHSTTGILNTV